MGSLRVVSHHDFAWLQSHSGFSTSEIHGSDGYYRYQSDTDDTLRTTFDSVHSVQRIDGSGDTRYHGNRGLAGDGWNSNWYEETPSGGGIEVSQGSYHLALTHDDERPNTYDVTVASGSTASVELPGPYRLPTNPQANTPPSGTLGPGGFSRPDDPSEVAGLHDQVAAAGSSAAAANAAHNANFLVMVHSPGNPETPGTPASENSLQGSATMAGYAGSQSSLTDSANPAAIAAGATTGLPTTVSGLIGGQGDLCERFPDSCSEASWHPPTRHEETWLEFGDRVRQSVSGSFTGYWSNVGSTLKGYFWTTPKELVSGTLHLVLNPGELIDAAWLVYKHPELVPQAIWDDIKEKASHSEGQGQLAADAVLVLIPVTKVKELARIAQLVKKFGKVLPDGAVAPNRGFTGQFGRLDPNDIRFSQTTAGGRGRAAELRESMRNGWNGPAVDAVRTPDGIVTIDNTRIAIARELGIPEVPVKIRLPSDPLPESMLGRFGDAKTWGEALLHRTGGQRPPLGPTGTPTIPRLP